MLRRQFIPLAGASAAILYVSRNAFAQMPAGGPKLTQILKRDIEGQNQTVQETIVSIVDYGPGVSAPWHMHPSAQEMIYALEGDFIVDVEGRGTTGLRPGEAYIIPGDVPHLARNASTTASAKALAVHTRGMKDQPFVVLVKP